jgi:hypothetical protein
MAKRQTKTKRKGFNPVPPSEEMASYYASKLETYIEKNGGQFLRDEDDSLHVIIAGRRIPINYESNNRLMVGLMIEICKVSTLSQAARAAIQRLQVYAGEKAGKMIFRKFSALTADRLYVPLEGGGLLQVTAASITTSRNGENEDSFWVEHPYEEPLSYNPDVDSREALQHFERIVVESQACAVSEMKWFVAMAEGFFPYIRDAVPNRFIVVHTGATQQGKTSGAQRFTLLHGLGQVKGDYTVASLGNVGDIGLLVLDNKEQANFTQDLIDFCLFLATGAERARSSRSGEVRVSRHTPVGVITTIEGVFKPEMLARSVEVQYVVSGPLIARAQIEAEIKLRRHEISSALMLVLQKYFHIKGQNPSPNPIPEFEEHFAAICDLLRAYSEVAGKPAEWAEEIIAKWSEIISKRSEEEEDDLEQPLLRVFDQLKGRSELDGVDVCVEGKNGFLYVTTASALLSRLQQLNLRDRAFPVNASGLSKRLRSAKFRAFRFLDTDSAPELAVLKRTSNRRPIGFFFEDEEDDQRDSR